MISVEKDIYDKQIFINVPVLRRTIKYVDLHRLTVVEELPIKKKGRKFSRFPIVDLLRFLHLCFSSYYMAGGVKKKHSYFLPGRCVNAQHGMVKIKMAARVLLKE